jgi:hypothetical protein
MLASAWRQVVAGHPDPERLRLFRAYGGHVQEGGDPADRAAHRWSGATWGTRSCAVPTDQDRQLVEAELIALDVLHHEARFVLLIGSQQTQAPSAERLQSSRFSLERRDSLVAGQPHPDSYVEV